MSERHLRTLKLPAERIRALSDFYESYATLALRQSEETNLETAELDAASALRTAGEWAMVLDPRRATDLLVRSAQIWHRLGYGFGTYLLAALQPDSLEGGARENQRRLFTLLSGPSGVDAEVPTPLLHPQQQAYLLLASTYDAPSANAMREVAMVSPHRLGVVPTGALGMPLRVYWDVAIQLLPGGDDRSYATSRDNNFPRGPIPVQLDVIAGHLETMAVSYATAIDSAMANEYLWSGGAAPVDVGDVDIAAIAVLASRRFGIEQVLSALARRSERHDPLTRVPLELAGEMASYLVRRSEPPEPEGRVVVS